jgi:hypothetical protein
VESGALRFIFFLSHSSCKLPLKRRYNVPTFRLTIRTDGAAFHDSADNSPSDELARLLRQIADRIEQSGTPSHYLTIHDINGNDCGRFALKPTN